MFACRQTYREDIEANQNVLSFMNDKIKRFFCYQLRTETRTPRWPGSRVLMLLLERRNFCILLKFFAVF